jgi:hypothetical protein
MTAVTLHDMRSWYHVVEGADWMIPALFLPPCTARQAAAIRACYHVVSKVYYAEMRRCNGEVDTCLVWSKALELVATQDAEVPKILGEVEAQIAGVEALSDSQGVFVRLSTRSPKDCLLKPASGNLGPVRGPVQDAARTILQMICSSNRVAEDLNAICEEGSEMPCLVVRPWVQLMPWSEVRVFVCGGQVTCASQYAPYADYGLDLLQREQQLISFVMKSVLSNFPTSFTAVIDIGLCGDAETAELQWKVIELNPFHRSTSGCLFSWVVDTSVIHNGPFEFRVYM